MKKFFHQHSLSRLLTVATVLFTAIYPQSAGAQPQSETMQPTDKQVTVEIRTTMGTVTVTLYNDTPRHRDNFIRLTKEGFYDGVLFHRVIREFVAQAGDPFSRTATPGQMLGEGGPGYKIEAEILYPQHFHKYGALAAAREDDDINPERRSGGSQFYIVTGKKYTPGQLKSQERAIEREKEQEIRNRINAEYRDSLTALRRAHNFPALTALQDEITEKIDAKSKANPFRFTEEVREAYTTIGGVPHLDRRYTVFGEVVSGMDVIEKITEEPTDNMGRPIEDIRIISMKVIE